MNNFMLSIVTMLAMVFAGNLQAQDQQQQQQRTQQQAQQQQEQASGIVLQKEDDFFTILNDEGEVKLFRTEVDVAQLTPQQRQQFEGEEQQREQLREQLNEIEQGERVTVHYRSGMTPTENIASQVEKDERGQPGMQDRERPEPGAAAQQDQQRQQEQQQQEQQRQQMGQDQDQETDSTTGTIMQKEDESFTLRTDDGRMMTFRTQEDDSQLRQQDQQQQQQRQREQQELQQTLQEVEDGDRVTVHYRSGPTPTEHIAVSLERSGDTPRSGEASNDDSPYQMVQDQQQQDQQQQNQQQQNQQQQNQQQQDQMQQDEQLPATSSMLPLVAGMGLLTLVAGLGLGVVARRQN